MNIDEIEGELSFILDNKNDEIEKLKADLWGAEEILRWYENKNNYIYDDKYDNCHQSNVCIDNGERARNYFKNKENK